MNHYKQLIDMLEQIPTPLALKERITYASEESDVIKLSLLKCEKAGVNFYFDLEGRLIDVMPSSFAQVQHGILDI